jgi:hypothetical protein
MIQEQIRFDGEVAPCSGCGKQPFGYFVRGKNTFFVECARCGVRTAAYCAMQLALQNWEAGETLAFLSSLRR